MSSTSLYCESRGNITPEDSSQVLGSLTLHDFMETSVELQLSKKLVNQGLRSNIHRMQFTLGIMQNKKCRCLFLLNIFLIFSFRFSRVVLKMILPNLDVNLVRKLSNDWSVDGVELWSADNILGFFSECIWNSKA